MAVALVPSLAHYLGRPLAAVSDVAWELLGEGGRAVHCLSACLVLLGSPPQNICHLCSPHPLALPRWCCLHCGALADSLFVSFPQALPTPPLYSALTMNEWPDAAPPVPPPPDRVDKAASHSGTSSHSDASSHNDDPLES